MLRKYPEVKSFWPMSNVYKAFEKYSAFGINPPKTPPANYISNKLLLFYFFKLCLYVIILICLSQMYYSTKEISRATIVATTTVKIFTLVTIKKRKKLMYGITFFENKLRPAVEIIKLIKLYI